MTVTQAVSKLLAWVQAQVGTRESGNNWNKYAEDPNMVKLLGWKVQNQPWCNIFCNSAFISVFGLETGAAMIYQPIGHGSAACRTSAQFFKDHGAFTNSPQPGDVVFFNIDGGINHQGIVTRVSGGIVSTVEGNSSDMVAARTYSIGSSSIAGYGRPNWDLVSNAQGTSKPLATPSISSSELISVSVPVLKKGARSAAVAAMQGALKFHGNNLASFGGIDGDFGSRTDNAIRSFQRAKGLSVDGICGAKTWEVLLQ